MIRILLSKPKTVRIKISIASFKYSAMDHAQTSLGLSSSQSASLKQRGPNYFVALQVKSSTIWDKFRLIQNNLKSQDPRLIDACVPIEKSHVTLGVFYANEDSLKSIEEIVGQAVSEYRSLHNTPIPFQLKGLGHFNHKVLFVRPFFSNVEVENKFLHLWKLVADKLLDAGYMKPRDAEVALSRSHVTLMKLSLLKDSKVKMIPKDLYDSYKDAEFGESIFTSVQILSMSKPKDEITGYYHCEREFDLSSETFINENTHDLVAILRQDKIDARSMVRDMVSKKTS